MARTKPKGEVIESLHQVEAALKNIACIDRKMEAIKADMNENIELIKTNAAAKVAPLKGDRKNLETALKQFFVLKKSELFRSKKSLELTHGTVGFRKSSKLKALAHMTWEQILGKLKEFGMTSAIRSTEKVNREELRTWSDSKLESIGVAKVESDEFFFEVAQEQLSEIS